MKMLIKSITFVLFILISPMALALPDACTKTGAGSECINLKAGELERIIIQTSIKDEALPDYIREFVSYKIIQGDQEIIQLLAENSNITVCCQFSCDAATSCSQVNLPRQSCAAVAGRAVNSSQCQR